MAFPSQTPDYRRESKKKATRRGLAIAGLAFSAPVPCIVIMRALAGEAIPRGVVWLGVVLGVLVVLVPACWAITATVKARREATQRQPGTVELLTVTSSFFRGLEDPDYWELTGEMQIRLDSGHTFRGSYRATLTTWQMRRTRRAYTPEGVEIITPRDSGDPIPHFQEWFVVGAVLPCLYNPTNPDQVLVLPSDARGERVPEPIDKPWNVTSDYVWFYSAT